MSEQRYSRSRFARGMLSAMRGETSPSAVAFARNVCEVITLHANSLTQNKWGG
jgi:hypothetical protein